MTHPGPLPSPAELEVLRILAARGPSTVREVHEARSGGRPARRPDPGAPRAYTTTLKLLQNLHEKGLVSRDDARRSHVFAAAANVAELEVRMVEGFIDSVFQGSAGRLVLRALAHSAVTDEELAEILALADRLAEEGG